MTVAVSFVAGCGGGETALARGDRFWADSSFTEALAEYRLALRQGGDEAALARVAHAYAWTGQLEAAREYYGRLLARTPEYADQAVYDLLEAAERSRSRGDRFGMAGAVEAALEFRPDLTVPGLAPQLARYYADTGDSERALEFFERAIAGEASPSAADLLYEIGIVYEKQGNCRDAIGFFTAYQERAPFGSHTGDARWHTGNCAFELGRAARQAGHPTEALRYLGLVLDLGVPENVQDQAWFERGEVLFALGRTDEARFAYQMVLELNPARTGQLVTAAINRIDRIRFGY